MIVVVDTDRCAGHGICVSTCPEVFILTDDGYATVGADATPTAWRDAVETAIAQCPEHAISACTA
ncbi:ferredoxin [Mycolicibacterium iranicum]|jgi:ferredoxin|uniref:Ferredoxin n=1 Tax=Mycolicibacterium iranicum TaxID=912594 RepID=A0A1X1X349_MYCIR|nr:ferredoxin [Mycolicibacterium iranicum]ORV93148.1 ferredoxin [Mycolicibacterium iranicum]